MNWLDITILVILAVAVFYGLKTGIIKAVLSLAGLIVGVVLAGRFYTGFANVFGFISNESIANAVAFGVIVIGVMVIAAVIANVLKWITSLVMLGWVNRLGGAVLGLIMGAILCGALLTLWGNFLGTPVVFAESNLAGILLDRFPAVLALLPGEFDAVRSFFQ
jgi:membrane protein required for colicin V production